MLHFSKTPAAAGKSKDGEDGKGEPGGGPGPSQSSKIHKNDGNSEAERGKRQGRGDKEEGGPEGGGGKRHRSAQPASNNRGGPLRAHSGLISTLVRDATTGVMVQVLGERGGAQQQQQPLLAGGTLVDGFVEPQVRVHTQTIVQL